MKRAKRSFRAVSTVLAFVMLIIIIVIAALVVYAWFMGYIGSSTEKMDEAIRIASIANDPTDVDLLVYVQNIGEVAVQLDEAGYLYVNGELVVCAITGANVSGGVATVGEGKTATLRYVGGAGLPDEEVTVKVTTVSGISAEKSGYPSEKTYNPPTLNHFTFGTVDDPQTSGMPFTVTISAVDQYDDLFAGYSGVNTLSFANGEISPTATGNFSDGVWIGEVTVTGSAANVTITTAVQSNPFWTGTSNTFALVAPLMWNKTYGGTAAERAHSIVKTSDGGYAIAGDTSSLGAGSNDFWLVKTDASGNVEWNQTYGGTGNDRAYSVVEALDGGYATVGYTESFGAGTSDFWVVKTDEYGNTS